MFRFYLFLFITLIIGAGSFAQTYSPITITGYNSDLFAEVAPNSLATTSMSTDLTDHVMYTTGFAMAAGLPAGVVNSGTVVSGTKTYQIAPYNLPNALYVDVGATQSLTLFATGSYSKLSLMGFSAEGASTLNIKLTFTDGTTTNCGNFTLADWFDGANAVYCCFSRCIRTPNAPYNIDGLPSNPRFYPIDISLSCDDQKKNLQTITISNLNGTTSFTNAFILAVSGVSFSQNIFSLITDVTCAGGNDGSATAIVSGTASPYTFLWNTLPPQTTATANNLSAGTYTCTITDANSCTTDETVIISELPPAVVSIVAAPSTICDGDNSQLTVSGLTSFSWLPGGQTTASINVSPAVTTTYTVSGTDVKGCDRQQTVTVNVNLLPTVTINPNPAAICAGGSIILQATGAVNYTWSPATGLSNSTIANPTASPAGTTSYIATGTNGNGCSNTDTVEVTVNSSPVVVATANPPAICQGNSSTLTLTGLTSFTWNPGGQTIAPINVSPVTTTTYTVSGTGANGCSGQTTVTVTVNGLPVITATPSSVSVCPGGSAALIANGGIAYNWLPAAGLSNTGISNPVASPAVTTTYTVTGFDASGCSSTANVVVTVFPSPTISVTANPANICEGTSSQLSVTGLTSFTWNPGGQNISPITVSPVSTTAYTVSGTDANGCSGTEILTLAVDPLPIVTAGSNDTLICDGTSTTLNAYGTATQHEWNPGGLFGNSIIVSPSDTTMYIVTGTLGNCTSADTLVINVVPSPTALFSPSALTGCDPLLISFMDQSINGIDWSWSFGDGTSSTEENPVHLFPTGTWSITQTVMNVLGCSATFVLPDMIKVHQNPVADFKVDPDFNQPVELNIADFQFTNETTGALFFQWDFDDNSGSTEVHPKHSYTVPGNYTVTLIAIGEGDCTDSITKSFIEVIPATVGFIPTAFTPNGDGINDVFMVANTNLEAINVKIFNRWGKMVFHGIDPSTGWNGMLNEIPAEVGVYVYSIEMVFNGGKQEVHKGNLTLLR